MSLSLCSFRWMMSWYLGGRQVGTYVRFPSSAFLTGFLFAGVFCTDFFAVVVFAGFFVGALAVLLTFVVVVVVVVLVTDRALDFSQAADVDLSLAPAPVTGENTREYTENDDRG